MPVSSSQDQQRPVRSVHCIASGLVWNPEPNAASNFMYGQAGFWLAGTGEAAAVWTPIRTPARSDAPDVVPDTDTDPEVTVQAAVSTASATWSVPFCAVTDGSFVHPAGANAWLLPVVSPQTAPMTNACEEGADRDRDRDVAAAA